MSREFTILLTDDNREFIQNLSDILELKGYRVLSASDGFEALEIVKISPVDLIILDIKMPVMNGVETFKRIKQISPGTPVIMLTAFALEELIKESLKEGAFACLKKPLNFEELFTTIENAMQNGSMILVVDDDQNLCRNLMDVLNQKGFKVSFANDSISAIEQVKSKPFDILLLDMKLPPLNGLETYLKIKNISPGIVVIIITGCLPEMEEMAVTLKRNGAYALLEKPIDMSYLISLLGKLQSQTIG
jgi:two-component system, NtrC family, response regulator HydG